MLSFTFLDENTLQIWMKIHFKYNYILTMYTYYFELKIKSKRRQKKIIRKNKGKKKVYKKKKRLQMMGTQ